MNIGLIGVEEGVVELSERELFAKTCRQFFRALPFPTVLLETCQRTELYFASVDMAHALHLLSRHLEHLHLSIYAKEGRECFFHLACVTAGLSSALVGESDIQRQVKQAYNVATSTGRLTGALHFLFQKSLKVGKAVRSAFLLTGSPHSLEKVVFEQASEHIDSLKSAPLLFIGNSVTNRKILSYFQKRGAVNMTLCTRSKGAASVFCLNHQANLMGWDQLASSHHFEGVIVATHVEEPLLHPGLFPAQARTRFMCDLSVPRCIAPQLKERPFLKETLNKPFIGSARNLSEKSYFLNSLTLKSMLVSKSMISQTNSSSISNKARFQRFLKVYDMDQMTALLRQKEQLEPGKLKRAQAYINVAVEKQIEIFNTKSHLQNRSKIG